MFQLFISVYIIIKENASAYLILTVYQLFSGTINESTSDGSEIATENNSVASEDSVQKRSMQFLV